MSIPKLEQSIGGYKLIWNGEHVSIDVTRLRDHHDGRTTCELRVLTSAPGYAPHLHQGSFNLLSLRSRADLARTLAQRYTDANWAEMLEQTCTYVLQDMRAGEPLQVLDSDDELEPVRYLIEPLVFEDEMNLFFGSKGSTKSYIGLALAMCTNAGIWPDSLNLAGPGEPTPSLYLDWETSYKGLKLRNKLLANGLGLPRSKLHYRRCIAPLADDVDHIYRLVQENNIRFVVIDSVGPASGADLNSTEPAFRFLAAVRKLGITSLLITHTSKSEESKKTAYGNVYYTNLPRSIWEIRKVQEEEEPVTSVGLFQRDTNLSRHHAPLGFRISFLDDGTFIQREDLRDMPEFASQLGLRQQLVGILRAVPRQTVAELAEEVSTSQSSVRATLNRYKSLFVRVGENWALIDVHTPEVFR